MSELNQHIWVISDGKPGHINQSLGLVEALQRNVPSLTWQEVKKMPWWQALRLGLKTEKASRPALVVSAGHRTHFSLLILAKLMRVPSIVLMKPSLPLSWFNLCLIPEHDSPPARNNIIQTLGALNRIQASEKDKNTGIFLLGGPSKHFAWDEDKVIEQINTITKNNDTKWVLTTSRRTPISTVEKLSDINNISITTYDKTTPEWLPSILAKSEYCWVTEDSVSMIYEALTAGCKLGLLNLSQHKQNRLSQGIKKLQQLGYINNSTQTMPALAEADRCAAMIKARFLS